MTYHQPKDFLTKVNSVEIAFRAEGKVDPGWYKGEITQSYVVVMESDDPWRVKDWRERIISPLEDLLTFATESLNATLEFKVSLPESRPDDWATVIFRSRHQIPEFKPLYPSDMLFTYSDVADRFDSVLQAWVRMYDDLGTVIRLLLGVIHHRSRFFSTESEFLTVVQALESYHHARREGLELSVEEHLRRLDLVLGLCEEKDTRKWLKRKLTRSNSKGLNQRLDELLQETALITDPVLAERNRQEFVTKVVWARNFLSHLDHTQRDKRLSPNDLLDARDTLLVALQGLILEELGFSEQVAAAKVQATRRYRNIGSWMSVGLEPGDDGTAW
jgi:hypothetical protein